MRARSRTTPSGDMWVCVHLVVDGVRIRAIRGGARESRYIWQGSGPAEVTVKVTVRVRGQSQHQRLGSEVRGQRSEVKSLYREGGTVRAGLLIMSGG